MHKLQENERLPVTSADVGSTRSSSYYISITSISSMLDIITEDFLKGIHLGTLLCITKLETFHSCLTLVVKL